MIDADSNSVSKIANSQMPLHDTLSQSRGFKIGLLNINGLLTHIEELNIIMCKQMVGILAINETKLDVAIPDKTTRI